MKVLIALSVVTAVLLGFSEGGRTAVDDVTLYVASVTLGEAGVLVHEYMSCLEDGDIDGLKKALDEIKKSYIRSKISTNSERLEAALKRKAYEDFSTLTFARDLKIQLDILGEKYDTLLGIDGLAPKIKPFKPSNVPAPFWSGPAKVGPADKIDPEGPPFGGDGPPPIWSGPDEYGPFFFPEGPPFGGDGPPFDLDSTKPFGKERKKVGGGDAPERPLVDPSKPFSALPLVDIIPSKPFSPMPLVDFPRYWLENGSPPKRPNSHPFPEGPPSDEEDQPLIWIGPDKIDPQGPPFDLDSTKPFGKERGKGRPLVDIAPSKPFSPMPLVDFPRYWLENDSPPKRPNAHPIHEEPNTGHGGSSFKRRSHLIMIHEDSPTTILFARRRRNDHSAGKKPTS